jgi:hypothetical protein
MAGSTHGWRSNASAHGSSCYERNSRTYAVALRTTGEARVPVQREGERQRRVHLWLYESDVQWIQDHFGPVMGISKPVRLMVRKFRQTTEARVSANAGASAMTQIREQMDGAD